MMGGNPSSSWWRIMGSSPISPQQEEQEASPSLFSSSSSAAHPQLVHGGGGSSSPPSTSFSDDFQELPHSWSQLLLGGLTGEEDKFGGVVGHFQPFKKLEKWEDLMNPITPTRANHDYDHDDDDVKQEQQASQNRSEDQEYHHHQFQSHTTMPVSSPRSCVTSSFSSNNHNSKNNSILDFSNTKALHVPPDHHSSECNSKAGGGVCKKARVLSSSSQPPLKVRKEKLGDRLTALHQLVSPFGKTDTASVLLEAIGYIRFLQGQIETLSIPYLGKDKSSGNKRPHHPVNQEGRIGSLLGVEAEIQMDSEEKVKDLRSRGLCLVPVSCTQQVGSDNGADYWAPAFGSGGGF